MPPARDMLVIQHSADIHTAATAQERIRIQGVVTEVGQERARYRNAWLRIATVGTSVRITASTDSPLGLARPGAAVDVALDMTGMLDLPADTYLGRNARVIAIE